MRDSMPLLSSLFQNHTQPYTILSLPYPSNSSYHYKLTFLTISYHSLSLKELLLGAIDERKRVSASKGQRPLHPDYLTQLITTLRHSLY